MKRVLAFLRGLPKSQRLAFGVAAAGVATVALVNRTRDNGTEVEKAAPLASPSGVTTFTPGGVDPAGFGDFTTGFVDSLGSIESRLEMVEGTRATRQAREPAGPRDRSSLVDRVGANVVAILEGRVDEFPDSGTTPVMIRDAVPVTLTEPDGTVRRGVLPPVHLDPFPAGRPPTTGGRGTAALTDLQRARARQAGTASVPRRRIDPPVATSTVTTSRRVGPSVRRVLSPWAGVR